MKGRDERGTTYVDGCVRKKGSDYADYVLSRPLNGKPFYLYRLNLRLLDSRQSEESEIIALHDSFSLHFALYPALFY